jgi:molecular chaperone DnaK
MYLGIDFGTCYSSAAVWANGELKRVKEPLKLGYSFPSSVFVNEKGELFVGEAAENQRRLNPERYRRAFKRDLGASTPFILGDRQFLPEDLVAAVLKTLKREAEEMVQTPLERAVVTVPATYTVYRKQLMEKATKAAGFTTVELLAEPVAAAMYYDNPMSGGAALAEGEVLLVYDLGGGTFDAALLQKRGG